MRDQQHRVKPSESAGFSESGARSGALGGIDPSLAKLAALWPRLSDRSKIEIIKFATSRLPTRIANE
jgi:hypothetical protein